ncbi:MAG: bi-domain-containing oxidoreductase, partial [Gemmataceae bacterium]
QVRRMLQKVRDEGLFNALAQARAKLDEPMAMGYCSAGTVLACGAGVQQIQPGDRVASNGPHAGIVCVPKHLCAAVPDGVPLDQAALTVLGAIALNGVRLAQLGLGDAAFVIGLGLVGQLTVALLKANGCRVLGSDPDAAKCALALRMGAERAQPNLSAKEVVQLTRGLGADAVLITASTPSDGPVELAGEAVRRKGRVVAVGAVGMNLPRRPYYFKEAEFVVSCSYGPGRYDPEYEERGHDYPAGHVRWTEQRNMQAFLDLLGSRCLDVAPLITHRFAIDAAEEAYRLIDSHAEPFVAIVLEYPPSASRETDRRVTLSAEPRPGKVGVGCLGVGNFARMVLLPAIRKCPHLRPRLLCSAGGLSAIHSAAKLGFEAATADEHEVFGDADVDAVFILTRHDQHAEQVVKALRAGKHVFVEKPLALTIDELTEIESALDTADRRVLMVGFNRRFSPAAVQVRQFFDRIEAPLTVSIRFNAGEISPEHWTQNDAIGGGRIIGEACHAIDLATFLTQSPPLRVFAESVGGPWAPTVSDDQCFLTMRHANGSISSIGYLAGGDRAFAKERIEVLGGGRLAVIDDFRTVTTCAGGKTKKKRSWQQDKGHRAGVEAFARSLTEGTDWPISWQELRAVTMASFLAVRSLREGTAFEINAE